MFTKIVNICNKKAILNIKNPLSIYKGLKGIAMGVSKVTSKTNTVSGVLNAPKCVLSGINSIIEEGLKAKKTQNTTNPLKNTNEARISYLQNALNQAVALNKKLRGAYRSFRNKLSGMIKITSNQQADLEAKRIAFGKADMNEDLLRSSLMDAYHSQGMYYNA